MHGSKRYLQGLRFCDTLVGMEAASGWYQWPVLAFPLVSGRGSTGFPDGEDLLGLKRFFYLFSGKRHLFDLCGPGMHLVQSRKLA